MAADVNILREFLVRIGFQVDDVQFKKVHNTLEKTKEWMVDLGEAFGVVSYLIERNVSRIAEQFDRLYYSSARIGASAGNLQNFTYGAQMIGVSADTATSSLEGMARALRDSPGSAAFLNQMGIATQGRQTTQIMDDLLDRMGKMQPFMRAQVGGMFGMDSDTINQMVKFRGQMKEAEQERRQMQRRAGLDPDKLAAQSAAYERNMLRLHTDVEILEAIIANRFLPMVDRIVRALTAVAGFAGGLDKETGGASTYVGAGGAVAGALYGTKLIKRTVGNALRRLLGGAAGETTAAAETGAAAEAGVTGASGLAAAGEGVGGAVAFGTGIGEIALVVAAVAAILGFSVYELHEHWAQVKKASDGVRDWTAHTITAAAKAVKSEASYEANQTVKEGRQFIAWASKGLDAFAKGAEGDRLHPYGDIARNRTIGYGHKILRGEHFGSSISEAQANALYRTDMARSQRQVAALTAGMKLGGGQLDALADFQFNTGALAKSRLLTLVRSGNFEAAAKEFERWDHARVNGHLVESKGLLNRRLGEEAMFRGGMVVHQKTDIHVQGSGDPHSTARQVVRLQGDVAAEMVRNARGATH